MESGAPKNVWKDTIEDIAKTCYLINEKECGGQRRQERGRESLMVHLNVFSEKLSEAQGG